eukprot:scaffold2500_cov172-Chaetoceros_neogracile.AAC.2
MEFMFTGPNLTLNVPLGNWNKTSTLHWKDHRDWFVTPDKKILYFRLAPTMWHRFIRKNNSYRLYNFEFLVIHEEPITSLFRATVESNDSGIQLLNYSMYHDHQEPTTPMILLGQYSIPQPPLAWTMSHLTSSPSISDLLQAIRDGTPLAVSDGSFYPLTRIGAAAWIITTPDQKEWIEGGGVLPRPPLTQDPYRSELGGLLGMAVCLSSMAILIGPSANAITTSCAVTTACDGLSALNKVNIRKETVKPTWKNFDLITPHVDLWTDMPFPTKLQHVLGHQDNLKRPLTLLEKLNVQMDARAKHIALNHQHYRTHQLSEQHAGYGKIFIDGILVTGHIQKTLSHHILHKQMIEFLANKWSIDEETLTTQVDWYAFGKARKEASFPIQRFMSKWISGDTATGRVMLRRKQRLIAKCPTYDEEDEHLLHILTCPSTESKDFRTSLIAELAVWLRKEYTEPDLQKFLIVGITSWLTDPLADEIDYGIDNHTLFSAAQALNWN